MPEPDLVEIFAAPLHRSGDRYLVAGSVGAMVYSEPRLTIDIDLAVVLGDETLAALPSLYPEPDFYCPPVAVLHAENRRDCRAHFNVVHVPTGLKADFFGRARSRRAVKSATSPLSPSRARDPGEARFGKA